jgi:hypothetical protein
MKRILNRDYTLEGGYQVQTAEYLFARGSCCDSGCRNCPYKSKTVDRPRIVSLVPSWTETLIFAGANIVGRTRFCIHPQDKVRDIPIVGGTKNLNLDTLLELNPDFVLLDKEENTKEMAAKISSEKLIATHIRSLEDLKSELSTLSDKFKLPKLSEYSQRLNLILNQSIKPLTDPHQIPGVLEWWIPPDKPLSHYQILYVIWKNPWMRMTEKTFIGQMLKYTGVLHSTSIWNPTPFQFQASSLYPEFHWDKLPENALLLFSSEPYPFQKFKKEYVTQKNPHPAALLDGELYSWFGIRALRFLEELY